MIRPGMLFLIFYSLPVVLGFTLACVGLILGICEGNWEKEAGSLGSTGFFLSALLCLLPAALYLAWKLLTGAL